MATRILVADDHLAVREGVRAMLETEADFEVVGEAADGLQAMQRALELRPDLIVLDNSMPKMTGLEVARSLRSELPDTRIVFLTLSIVVFEPDTEVTIVSLNTTDRANVSAVFRQTGGTTWHVIDHPLPATATYEVITPTADATVHGTAFQVRVSAQSSEIATTDGVVTVVGSGQTVSVTAGLTTTIAARSAPSAPKAIDTAKVAFAFDRSASAVVVDASGRAPSARPGWPMEARL